MLEDIFVVVNNATIIIGPFDDTVILLHNAYKAPQSSPVRLFYDFISSIH